MVIPNPQTAQESPARRLEILYVASFLMIVALTAFGQYFILRELSRQAEGIRSVARLARQRSLGHPLSLSALALVGAEGGEEREDGSRALSKAIVQGRRKLSEMAEPGLGGRLTNEREVESSWLLKETAAHGRAALRSADALLAMAGRSRSASASASASALGLSAEAGALVRAIVSEETAFESACWGALQVFELETAVQIKRLQLFELELFVLVLVVLVLEGYFVVRPAIGKIRHFMDDMARSHEELKGYARKLERSNKELQDFASVASHDLQEPLRKVQAFSDRLRSRCAGSIDDQGRDYLDRVQNAAKRMQTLINDLLTFARVASKAQPFVPTDLAAITREVVSDLEVRIEQAQGRVEVDDLPNVDADPLQVRQLMQNLIGNSLKYQRADVPPVVRVSSKRVVHEAAGPAEVPPRPYCQILVEDNGIGFDEIYSDRIFTIFQRLHGRSEYEGTGVGLAVCRKIVERHGGSITAKSQLGEGSTFIVTLPIRQPKESTTDGLEI